MSKVRSKDTKPEMIVRRAFFALGYRYRIHRKDLPGTPDIVFPKYRIAINVNGCFWHGCSYCKHARMRPATNAEYWKHKLNRNIERDKRNRLALEQLGWKVLDIWECEIKQNNIQSLIKRITAIFENSES